MSSKIEWTDETWNPTTGCTRVSAGCDNCYAKDVSHIRASSPHPSTRAKYAGLTMLNGRHERHFNGVVRCHEDTLDKPLRWRKPRRIFVNSMSDLFHKGVPFEFVDRVFAVMSLCPQHTFQILTKRPERMEEYLNRREPLIGSFTWKTPRDLVMAEAEAVFVAMGSRVVWRQVIEARESWPLPNVWLGKSCEDQPNADERIQHLLRCPAAARFLSCEPLLGPLGITEHLDRECDCQRIEHGRCHALCPSQRRGCIHQVIVGGESGPKARPMHPDWVRSIRDQCAAAGVPFFFKQWGEWAPDCLCDTKRAHTTTDRPRPGKPGVMFRCGKKNAGRLLDRVEHNGEPGRPSQQSVATGAGA